MKEIFDGRKYTKEEVILISKGAIGKTLKEIEDSSIYSFGKKEKEGKGSFGQLIENYLFGIENNSDSEPDFIDAGIELKVTPYKKIKGGKLSAKERLVLNIIDYNNEYKNDFKTSHFWFKNNKIQLLWYLWESSKNKLDYTITNEKLLELANSEDLKQIEDDWNTIIAKIKAGKAEDISEADTMYLGACTKGENSSSTRTQPFSDIPAMQRAFCFKTSYMTQLVRKYIGNYSNIEKLIKNPNDTFIDYVNNIVKKYIGKSQNELMKEFNIDSNAKSLNSILISRMFNISGKINDTDEFQKANIVPKTVRIEENGRIKESISFPYFKYNEIVKQDWETSELKENLETTKYLFFIFKKEKNEYIFKGIKLWNVPEIIIESFVKDLWIDTYNKVKTGNIVKSIENGIRKTNFMGMSENKICHLRPHGRDASDTCPLPVPDKLTGTTEYTKYCFWLNNSYIKEVLSEFMN
jgi:DNA mismatch repair protein MutH